MGNVPEWLDQSFCEGLLKSEQSSWKLTSWKVEPLTVSGDNYSSILYRVSIICGASSFTVIVKTLPQGSAMREYMLSEGIFRKEAELYQKVFPAMMRLYTDRGGNKNSFCPQSFRSPVPDTVVLQDLASLGYILPNRQEQLDLEHSVAAMRVLALFHGLSIGLHVDKSSEIEQYKENVYKTSNKGSMKNYTNLMLMDLASEVETWKGFERFGDKLRKYSETSVDKWVNLFEHKDGFFLALNHGDFWSSNMLFLYNESGNIIGVKLIDFQYSKYAPAVLDILYFLYASVQESVRTEFKFQLLGEYLTVLKETVNIVGPSEQLLSLDKLQEEMNEKMDMVALVAFTCLPAMVASKDEMANFGTSNDEETDDGYVQNPILKSIKGTQFRKILPSILIDLESSGIL